MESGYSNGIESHLLQMRGLKLILNRVGEKGAVSHLLQMRGLKPAEKLEEDKQPCRIFYRCVD